MYSTSCRSGSRGKAYKYIDSSDGEHELYHLERDPDEARNLIEREDGAARRLHDSLEAVRLGAAAPGSGVPRWSEMTPRKIEQMRALGYIE